MLSKAINGEEGGIYEYSAKKALYSVNKLLYKLTDYDNLYIVFNYFVKNESLKQVLLQLVLTLSL